MKWVKKESGFTLVELAIVMVIIGLLIGGILKGQELIKNATVTATAAQLKAFESAYTTFLDVYNGKPGDTNRAREKIQGCVNRCRNGDGNGWIWHANSALSNPGTDDLTPGTGELYQALRHMAAANLIGGVRTEVAASSEALVAAEIGGYLYVGEVLGNSSFHRGSGTAFTPGGIYVSNTFSHLNNPRSGRVLTASEAARLDSKVDDGQPGTGSMLAAGLETCVNGRNYRFTDTDKTCAFMFKIR